MYIKVPVAVETPAFLPAVFVVPIPTECLLINAPPSAIDIEFAVRIPVTIAPELFACILHFRQCV